MPETEQPTTAPAPAATSVASSKKLRVGILGAGPSGLAAALALESYASEDKIEITILDKNSSVTDYEGVEYAIQERACYALERISPDIKEQVLKNGNPMQKFCFYDERRKKSQLSVTKNPKYCYEVFRQQFLLDMEEATKRTTVLRNHFIKGLEFKENGAVIVNVEDKDPLEFDVVIAAEGLHSPTRKQLFPEVKIKEHDFEIIYLLVEAKPGQEMPKNFMELANGSYLQFNMGQFSTNSFFPLNNGRLAIAISFDKKTHDRIWKECEVDLSTPFASLPAETKKKIAGILAGDSIVFDNLFTNLIDLVPDWDSKRIYAWQMRDTDPLTKPYPSNGNVLLLGDAAHAMLPCIGQGASMAIEDSEAIGKLLANFAKTNWKRESLKSDLQQKVFVPFTRARYPVWKDLNRRARHAVKNFAWQDKSTGFTVAPFIPVPIIALAVLAVEWIKDLIGRRGY